ncbi:MAG: hypothetical protein A3K76_00115 [Euryarchaeota archaeon RBG_13_57_23]|nr:MAG: hypothetical protein A3K76_00115 [Euryarchaeota archaeon RBG_13_57_23]
MEREFSVKLEDSPGELARVTDVLQKDGVNLRTIAIEHYAKVVRVITSDPEKARQNLTESDMMFSERDLLVAKLKNGPGELARVSRALAEEGVNIDSAYMIDKDSTYVHMALAVSDENKAMKILKL